MVVRVVSWNLFHGRDHPPEDLGRMWLPGERRGERFVQVNRSLREEFAGHLAALEWDIALLQETPPRWLRPLAQAAHASGASVLTSRNWLAPLRAAIGDWNPDAIASNEGGSNVVLVRAPWRIEETRRLTLARRPERRRLIWARLRAGDRELGVADMHATSVGDHTRSAHELLRAAEVCIGWSGAATPLIVGGDMNLRPREHPWAFDRLRTQHELERATADDAVDHILARGMAIAEAPHRLPAEARDVVRPDGMRVRLSDHAVVVAAYEVA